MAAERISLEAALSEPDRLEKREMLAKLDLRAGRRFRKSCGSCMRFRKRLRTGRFDSSDEVSRAADWKYE